MTATSPITSATPTPTSPRQTRPIDSTILKDELCTRVEILHLDTGPVVQKIYRNRPFRLWQTFLRRSRAAREFLNLSRVRQAGLPALEPVSWSEVRKLGCVPSCTLTTRYLEHAQSLREVLRDHGIGTEGSGRARLVERMGNLIAGLHRAGVLWCTLTPRNFLLKGGLQSGLILLCDIPAAVHFRHSIHGRPAAGIDLYDAAFSPSRRSDFTAVERWRLVLAYCNGDRSQARGLWQRLCGRARQSHRLRKSLRVGIGVYLVAPFRRLIGKAFDDVLESGRVSP